MLTEFKWSSFLKSKLSSLDLNDSKISLWRAMSVASTNIIIPCEIKEVIKLEIITSYAIEFIRPIVWIADQLRIDSPSMH